jgi:hypothetical protein
LREEEEEAEDDDDEDEEDKEDEDEDDDDDDDDDAFERLLRLPFADELLLRLAPRFLFILP